MWKDITSYSQSDKERIPTAWIASTQHLKVVVTCGHRDYKPDWVMHCHALGIDTKHLKGCKSLDDAKRMAIEEVRLKIKNLSDSAQTLSA
jgi:hypothetical protein